MKPFLKWAGSKYKIIDKVKAMLPPGNRLIEPFVGSGAVFLNTDYDSYLLADKNPDLINLFEILRSEGELFIQYCKEFFQEDNNTANRYYELRSLFNRASDKTLKAGLMIYLNRFSFNGLWRCNSSGYHNVPFGKYTKPYFPEKEMRYFYNKAHKAKFEVADFREIMNRAEPGDIIYADPPYLPISKTANFTAYSAGGFSIEDQAQLAELANHQLANKGIPVLISNHNTEFTLNVYRNATIEQFNVRRHISCDGNNRNLVGELLALFN